MLTNGLHQASWLSLIKRQWLMLTSAHVLNTGHYTERRLARPLCKDDTEIYEMFNIKKY